MSRDYTPQQIYAVTKEFPDLYLSNLHYKMGDKEWDAYTKEEMEVRKKFPHISTTFCDRFIALYNWIPDKDKEAFAGVIDGFIQQIEKDDDYDNICNSTVPETLRRWYLGQLDPNFYYHEDNDDLFYQWCQDYYKNIFRKTGFVRLNKDDVIMDDELICDDGIIFGYMYATDKMCDIAGYKGLSGTDDYINFYPVYDVNDDTFVVETSGIDHGKFFEKKLKLNAVEKAFILTLFIETYFEDIEAFNNTVAMERERYQREKEETL